MLIWLQSPGIGILKCILTQLTVDGIEDYAWPASPEAAPFDLWKRHPHLLVWCQVVLCSHWSRNAIVQEMVHCNCKNYCCCCLVYKTRQWMMHNQAETNILQTPAGLASKTFWERHWLTTRSHYWNLTAELDLKLSLPVMIIQLHWVSWIFNFQMGSCYVKTIIYFPAVQPQSLLSARGKINKFVG